MKKQKWLTILLALCMASCAAAGLAACGEKENPEDDPPIVDPVDPPEDKEPDGDKEPDDDKEPEEQEPTATPMIDGYRTASGSFRGEGDEKVASTSARAIAVKKDGKFKYGTLSATVQTPGSEDNGIIFALSAPSVGTFWEGAGISYYFFFFDRAGNARLGKTDNGQWTNCAEKPISAYAGTYEMKVERDDLSVNCYVNGVLQLSYADPNPLQGTGYGLRAGQAGVLYSDVQCASQDVWESSTSEDYTAVKGSVVRSESAGTDASRGSTLALHKTKTLTGGNGTFRMGVTPSSNEAGIVFGADEGAQSYYTFGFTAARNMELASVKDGVRTVLASGVLSAGYSSSARYEVEVRKNGGEIGCYLHYGTQIIRYAAYTDEEPLDGEYVGLYASNSGSLFFSPETDTATTQNTAETLLFGHSYMELWSGYKTDFPEYTSIDDIGIGGSVATHWEALKEEVISYAPALGIYMIGINDLTGGLSPLLVSGSVETLLSELHAALPETTFVLVGVNYCPARSNLTAQIHELNRYYKNIAAKNSEWVKFADIEWSFNTDTSNAASTNAGLFTDGLHPTAAGYRLIAQKIKDAVEGKDQPAYDSALDSAALVAAKQAKKDSISGYSQQAYRAEEWVQAETYYNAMVEKIEGCMSTEQLAALDLSEELTALSSIRSKAAYLTEALLTGDDRTTKSAEAWTKNGDGTIHMMNFGYSVYTGEMYTDTDIAFCLTNNTNVIPVGGVFLRATFNGTGGIDGYLVSYVTNLNYIQIFRVTNGYSPTAQNEEYLYLGGWVYPASVVGPTFYVRIAGDKLYLSDENDIGRVGYANGIVVDLTNLNGAPLGVYEKGYTGVLCWAENAACDFSIVTLADTAAETGAVGAMPEAMLPESKKRG